MLDMNAVIPHDEDVARHDDPSDEAIGVRIQSVRFVNNMTQSAFGDSIGASGNVVGNWERGDATPRYHHLAKICFNFSVSADFILLGRMGQMTLDQREAYIPALQSASLDQKAKNAARDARRRIAEEVVRH